MEHYITTEYTISVSCPSCAGSSLTLAYFTDMHSCCSESESREMLTRIKELRPDLVLCGGDSIVARPGEPVDGAVCFLQRIASEFPLAVGTGNHEYRARLYPESYGSMYRSYRDPLVRTENVYLLENTDRIFRMGDIPVHVYGFDLSRRYYSRLKKIPIPAGEIRRVFGAPDKENVSILLSHNAASLRACLDWGADLSLFGHFHGGIMRFGGNRGLISPELRPLPYNAYGHFQIENRHGIISSGCGDHTLAVRVRNPREIVDIHVNITN